MLPLQQTLSQSPSLLNDCISEIKSWFTLNFFKLNNNKTEVLLIGSKWALSQTDSFSSLGDCSEVPSPHVTCLGVIFDSTTVYLFNPISHHNTSALLFCKNKSLFTMFVMVHIPITYFHLQKLNIFFVEYKTAQVLYNKTSNHLQPKIFRKCFRTEREVII